MYKIQNILPTWLKQTLYYSLFYSKLSYGILVWGTTTASNYNKLIIVQKKILRMCENYVGDKRGLRTKPLFIKYSMLKADQVYYFKLLQWIYKNRLHTIPVDSCTSYPIRKPHYVKPATRTNYGKQTLNYQTINILNSDHFNVQYTQSFHSFKNDCKNLLVGSDIAFSF